MRLRTALLPPLLLVTACGGGAARKAAPDAAPVRVAKAERMPVPREVSAVGHVEASSTVAVKPRVGGEVATVGFREGDDVAAGALLFQVDPRPYQAALAQAQSNLARDRARLSEAERNLERYEELVKKEYVTREQYDAARANVEALKATLQGDDAAVEQARLNLEFCRITAPVAGRTGNLLVDAGNVVKANDDKPMVVINRLEPVFVAFSLPEQDLTEVKARARASKLTVVATPPGGAPHEGELTFFDNAVDPASGTIQLKATFPNRDRALWPGQFANVTLTLATDAGTLVVPAAAIQSGQSGTYVWVVKAGNTAEPRPVKVTRTWRSWAVVGEGIAASDTVVTDGQLRLAPGVPVSVKEEAAPVRGTDAGSGPS